jgi:hypothetical protein
MSANETCPHCGAEQTMTFKNGTAYECGTFAFADGRIGETSTCLRKQVAAQAAEIERLRKELSQIYERGEVK